MSATTAKKRPVVSVNTSNQKAKRKASVVETKGATVKAKSPAQLKAEIAKRKPARPVQSAKPLVIKPEAPKEASVAEMNRIQLEQEISRLKGLLADMRARNDIIDPISGLPKRGRFMEMAGAEFNRTRRYGHNLTLVMASIAGYQRIKKAQGQHAADQVVTAVSEMCVSSTRFGVDILGRIGDDKIAMLLPETDMNGGQLCLERMRKLVGSMPITIDGEKVKVGLNVSARALKDEHTSFVELLVAA